MESEYASMEKDQLISMIHFLVKREEEGVKENQDLRNIIKELTEAQKQNKDSQAQLMETIEGLNKQLTDLTVVNLKLQQEVNNLLSQISIQKI